jgi:putative transposase
MSMTTSPNPYHGFRFPAEIIEHAAWLYHCFSLSLRDVETILAARGVVVSYESIREWSLRFGRLFANALKRRRPRPGDKWFMDEVFLRIGGTFSLDTRPGPQSFSASPSPPLWRRLSHVRDKAFRTWRDVAGVPATA